MKKEIWDMLNSANKEDILLGARMLFKTSTKGEMFWFINTRRSNEWATKHHICARYYNKECENAFVDGDILMIDDNKQCGIYLDTFGIEYYSQRKIEQMIEFKEKSWRNFEIIKI